MAEREVKVRITGDSTRLAKSFRDAEKSGQSFGKRVLGGIGRGLVVFAKAAAVASAAIGIGLVAAIRHGTKGLKEQSKVMAQTENALKSTGNAAKTTSQDIRTLTESLERKSGIDADQIQVGSNLLLTFKNIRNEVGANNDIFDRAQKTALDLSVAFGTNMKSASLQLGKALDDPVRGVAALRRSGISFTKDQQNLIKSLVESGDVLEAQKMILAEVETQVGGSAEAYGKTLPGQIDRAKRSFEKLTETLAGPLLEVGTEALEGLLVFFQDERIQKAVEAFGEALRDGLRIAVNTAREFISDLREIDGFKGRLEFVLDIGKDAVKRLAGRIADSLQKVDWAKVGEKVGPALSRSLEIPREAVVRILDLFTQYVVENADRVADAGAVIAAKILARLTDPAFWIANWKEALTIALAVIPFGRVAGIGAALVRVLGRPFAGIARPIITPVVGALNTILVRAAPIVARIGATIIEGITGPLRAFAGIAAQFVGRALEPFGRFGIFAARAVETGLRGLAGIVSRVGSQVVGLLVRGLSEGTAGIANAARLLATKAVDGIRTVFDRLPRLLRVLLRLGIANTIVNFISEAVDKARQLGRDIIDGIVSGIDSAASRVKDALVRAVGDPIQVAKRILKIRSPSGVTRDEIGIPMMNGIIDAIQKRSPDLGRSLRDALTQAVTTAVQDARRNLSTLASGLASMLGDIYGKTSADAQELQRITAAREARELKRREEQIRAAIAQVEERTEAEQRLQQTLLDDESRFADERARIQDQLQSDLTSARSRQARIDAQARADAALADLERRRQESQLNARAEYNRRIEQLDKDRAQAEQDLADFEEEQEIRRLEREIQAKKDAYDTDLANLVERFNTGAISAQEFRDQLDRILGDSSGDALGAAFAGAFSRQLQSLLSQLGELVGFAPGVSGPDVTSPSGTAYQEQLRIWEEELARRLEVSKSARKRYEDAQTAATQPGSPGGRTVTSGERTEINRLKGLWDRRREEWERWRARRPVPLAKGGILKRPILAGEAGPEAVIPLSTSRGRDYLADALEDAQRAQVSTPAIGQTVVINVTVNGNEFDAHQFARKLAPELRRQVALTRSV